MLTAVQRVCVGFAEHILTIMDKRPDEVGYEEWLNGRDALGGWGTLPLDHFRHINALHTLLDGKLTPAQLADVQANRHWHGVPADVIEQIVAVRIASDTWKRLFVRPPRISPESNECPPPRDW